MTGNRPPVTVLSGVLRASLVKGAITARLDACLIPETTEGFGPDWAAQDDPSPGRRRNG